MDKYTDIVLMVLAEMSEKKALPDQTLEDYYLEFDYLLRKALKVNPLELLKRQLELKISQS